MNYGRFFRLNQNLSSVEDGVAIFDYIDLPAYFGAAESNNMSPQYPISVTITPNSVQFRLHYGIYKISKETEGTTEYGYDVESLKKKYAGQCHSIKMAHMHEVIIDLPFGDGERLTEILKGIYKTKFPLKIKENINREGAPTKESSSGGRFLEQLIRGRYIDSSSFNASDDRSLKYEIYESMRQSLDPLPSYSSLWLMDLMKETDGHVYIDVYEKTGQTINKERDIDGFLRKLLLDFMFDLKHSVVFQDSTFYQTMFSGLISNFYFSALIHKCEYYYYRQLVSQAIKTIEGPKITKQEKNSRMASIKALYTTELVKAEHLWIQDIMNPQAEKDFEHSYPGRHNLLREVFEYYSFKQWPSWFAEPEEEMRRICFTMKDEANERHVCNGHTLIRYLGIKSLFWKPNSINDKDYKKIAETVEEDKENISRWFLKHYAFSDVFHLHWFKHANLLFICLFALPVLWSWFTREKLLSIYSTLYDVFITIIPLIILIALLVHLVHFTTRWINKDNVCESCKYPTVSGIVKERRQENFLRICYSLIFLLLLYYIVDLGLGTNEKSSIIHEWPYFFWGSMVFIVVLLTLRRSFVSCLHLFLPRLVASIALSWITLSMGFDLYVSYFDSIPSIAYIIVICVVVLFFVMYSINLVIPYSTPLRKLLRSLELMIISYFISLSIGFLIINFLGPKYLERGGFINDYYAQYVENDSCWGVHYYRETVAVRNGETIVKDSNFKSQVNSLNSVYLTKRIKDGDSDRVKRLHKVADITSFWGMDIFVLRDFLLMFSFIAMFTGIFIQLIIFGDNKQMTEL